MISWTTTDPNTTNDADSPFTSIIDPTDPHPLDENDHVCLDHPGVILREEFLNPLDVTQYRLAQATGLPESQVSKIVRGKASITATVATRLAAYFGTSAQFWTGLQADYDLERASRDPRLAHIEPFSPAS